MGRHDNRRTWKSKRKKGQRKKKARARQRVESVRKKRKSAA